MTQAQTHAHKQAHTAEEWPAAFDAIAAYRRSTRNFLPKDAPMDLIRHVLKVAQESPSNCNAQPWCVHVVSGEARRRLSAALLRDLDAACFTPDYPFDGKHYTGVFAERRVEQGHLFYKALGIERHDVEARKKASLRNLEFFDAPHVALLFVPAFGMMRDASDVGMYAQTLLLALTAHGLAGCPQTMLGLFAQTIRDQLGIPAEQKLLYGISFGYADTSASSWAVRLPRASIDDVVRFHS